ncbi:MAG: hypothetical protein GY810_28155 [Aureispira sp.]|nr:hypothetical protein [Aureispira sp.]
MNSSFKGILLLVTILLASIGIKNKVQVRMGGALSIGWNLYHSYQKPFTTFPYKLGDMKSVGQVLNVLPDLRLAAVLSMGPERKPVHLHLEAGVGYYPFSFDLEEFSGMGALSFPLLLTLRIPVIKSYPAGVLTLGGGVQFMAVELHQRFSQEPNPFFMTYVGEIGFGVGALDYDALMIGLELFTRFGMTWEEAVSLDVGIRFNLGWVARIGA